MTLRGTIAWLVLMVSGLIGPSSSPDLASLVADLSHRSFRVRDRAYRSLKSRGFSFLRDVRELAGRTMCPEARRALERIAVELVAERRTWVLETIDRRYGPNLPMIDAFWLDWRRNVYEHDIIEARDVPHAFRIVLRKRLYPLFVEACTHDYGTDAREWAAYREATRYLFIDLLEADCPVPMLDVIFLWMRIVDNRWIGGFRKAGPFDPLHLPGWGKPLPLRSLPPTMGPAQ